MLHRSCLAALALTAGLLLNQGQAAAEPIPSDTLQVGPVHHSNVGWDFYPLPQTRCRRDNDGTGIGVRLAPNPNGKVLVYMMGGSYCVDARSCLGNLSSFDAFAFDVLTSRYSLQVIPNVAEQGMFEPTSSANATAHANELAGYDQVYIPYCTGDLHAGRAVVDIAGFTQQFHGYENTGRFFQFVVERVVKPLQNRLPGKRIEVLLSGGSSGGFGVLANMDRLRDALPTSVDFTALSDSAPPFAAKSAPGGIIPTEQLARWRSTWNLDTTFLADCQNSACRGDNWLQPYVQEVLTNPAKKKMGFALISASNDKTLVPGFSSSEAEYRAGLLGLASWLKALRWNGQPLQTATYVVSGSDQHVFTIYDLYYSTRPSAQDAPANQRTLQQWLQGLYTLPTRPASFTDVLISKP